MHGRRTRRRVGEGVGRGVGGGIVAVGCARLGAIPYHPTNRINRQARAARTANVKFANVKFGSATTGSGSGGEL